VSISGQSPRGRRTLVRLVTALLLALVGIGLLAGPASAHTELLSSDPAPGAVIPVAPSRATLTFNEPVRVVTSAVHLFTADGAELPSPASAIDDRVEIRLPAGLADGSYTVAWRVISADGHPVAGSLVFSVGTPSQRTIPPEVSAPTQRGLQVAISAVQALVYLGMFLAVGLVIFRQLLLPTSTATEGTRASLLTVARRGADVGIAASLLMLPLTTINQSGDGLSALFAARSWEVDLGNPEPVAAILAVVGLALAVTTSAIRQVQAALPLAGGALALGSLALVGHSRSFGPEPLVVATDVVHVLAGSVWFGGLVGLTIALRRLGSAPAAALATVDRFSSVAAGLLVGVGVTGTVLTWRILGSWHGFVDTSFGRALLVKLSLVAVVVGLAAANRWRLLPRLRREVGSNGSAANATLDRLRRVVRIEGLVLVAVLAVTGVLVDRSPEPAPTRATSSPPGTSQARAEAGDIRVRIEIDPAQVGSNTLTISLTDRTGTALVPYADPAVSLLHGDVRLADQPLLEQEPGTYQAEVLLPESGTWTAEVTVRSDEFEARVIPVRFRVRR